MMKVMFVCTGNICRSAMAHGYMQHIVNNSNEKNEYLGDVVFDIAEQYNMTSIKMSLPGNIYLKKLTRK